MRRGSLIGTRPDFDELWRGFFGEDAPAWPNGGYQVPTDVFHLGDRLVIRMDLPGVDPGDVDVSIQENVLLVNGTRRFGHDAENTRFVRRGAFYGDFTQRIALGKGLNTDKVSARYDKGVLELVIPYADEVQPKKIEVAIGDQAELTN